MLAPDQPKTNGMRALDARRVDYEVFTFSDDIHSATGVAAELGAPLDQVYKTLVVVRPSGSPILILIGGDRTLDLKRVARATAQKKVRMAHHDEAERITGLRVGGISAVALLQRNYLTLIDRAALTHDHVLVSAGRRGVNLRIAVPDLIRVAQARVVDVTA